MRIHVFFPSRLACFTVLTAGVLALLAAPPAGAALVSYESFESYSDGDALSGKSGGTGWTGNWAALAGITAASASLSYSSGDVVIAGGSLSGQILGVNSNNTASRLFASQTGTLYISFLYKAVSGFSGGDFTQFSLNNDNTSINNSGSIGDLETSNTKFGSRIGSDASGGSASTSSTTDVTQGVTYFLVGKITKSGVNGANYDQMDLFLNPTTLTEGGLTVTDLASAATPTLTSFLLRTAGISGTDVVQFDELRVGTTWQDVVVPEPGSAVLLLGGAGLLGLMRRRR